MAVKLGDAVKTLMMVLMFVVVAAYAYVFSIAGYTSCFNLRARWEIALMGDFSVYLVLIVAWFVYKESSWILTIVFVALMLTTGSFSACGYILIQLYKLSPEEFSKDPLYYVLATHKKRDDTRHVKGLSIVTARVMFSALGCLVLASLIYTVIVDLSPSRGEFSPCLSTYLVDIYVLVVVLSVWIVYKESSWISASLWILSHLCFGTITLCVYIVRQLFLLSPHQPVSLVIFNVNNRNLADEDIQSSDPLLDGNSK